ncbi:hypothetical protein BH23PSE1_BH23PSE1_08760 [soil metagenome]
MSRRLVLCLMFATGAALALAISAVAAGWCWLAALALYSLGGSVLLVLAAGVAGLVHDASGPGEAAPRADGQGGAHGARGAAYST